MSDMGFKCEDMRVLLHLGVLMYNGTTTSRLGSPPRPRHVACPTAASKRFRLVSRETCNVYEGVLFAEASVAIASKSCRPDGTLHGTIEYGLVSSSDAILGALSKVDRRRRVQGRIQTPGRGMSACACDHKVFFKVPG
jgi:hypothetical protein